MLKAFLFGRFELHLDGRPVTQWGGRQTRDVVKVLATADALVLTEVYPAGEAPIVAADGKALARAIRVHGRVEPIFVESVTEIPAAILGLARDGDVVLTMGAGSIGNVPAALLAARPRSVNGLA